MTQDTVVIFWSNRDSEVARGVVIPYAYSSIKEKWWKEVILIVWGPSVNTLRGDDILQDKVAALIKSGVKVESCIECAENYDADELFRQLDIEVKYMGSPLTNYIKLGYHIAYF